MPKGVLTGLKDYISFENNTSFESQEREEVLTQDSWVGVTVQDRAFPVGQGKDSSTYVCVC